jgi:UDP-N-acetylmuramate--alanine ligase
MNLASLKKIHFVGIGGIGISALARLMQSSGKTISGSDLVGSDIISGLKKYGALITIGRHSPKNIPSDADLVVYTNAIKKTNPELKRAQQLKIPALSYPACLGLMMQQYRPLVVAGTHGKSTTTSMLAKIFITAGFDPTVVVGTKIKECHGSNARLGGGQYFIAEGDEYKEAFLNYQPLGLIINNIEADHLDYYKTEKNVVKAFIKLVKKIPAEGFLVANADDINVKKATERAACRVVTFGLANGDYLATHIVRHGELTRFAVKGLEQFDLAITVPGLHNVKNALAACVLALSFGIRPEVIQKALLEYSGAWRRFEIKGEHKGVVIIDDYAHHPTEIRATLAAARQSFPGRRIWCIFQPHSRDRTKRLFDDFVHAFNDCDKLILTEIYQVAGREGKSKISGLKLAQAIEKTKQDIIFIKDYIKITSAVAKQLKSRDVVITMGAGTITLVSDQLIKELPH